MIKPRLYISGGFYSNYKPVIYSELSDFFSVYDPEKEHDQRVLRGDSPAVYVLEDCEAIGDSQVVIAVQTMYPFVYGMAAEIGYAAAIRVPVIYVCLAKRVDGFLSGLSRATFTDLREACSFIRKVYAWDKGGEK